MEIKPVYFGGWFLNLALTPLMVIMMRPTLLAFLIRHGKP